MSADSIERGPVVFVPMCGDFVHVGHINILEGAAELGDVVVLLMTDDAMKTYKRAPRMSYSHRERILRSFKQVADVIPCAGPQSYAPMAEIYKPNFFYHGDDWKQGPQAKGRLAVKLQMEKHGGTLVEPSYTPAVSSTGFQQMFTATLKESLHTGVLLRGALNDLKRVPGVISRETGIGEDVMQNLIAGQDLDRENMDSVLRVLHAQYPMSMKHLVVDQDDSQQGVWYNSAETSKNSARKMNRTNILGDTTCYYTYMDTATSSLSPFKPELIEMEVHVNDNEPLNPLVVMNKGHLLSQLTFFIGPVNFYCTVRGERHCKVMNTGDSCLITPYVPHSFTTRDPDQYAAIVAVTFSTGVRDALSDLLHHDMSKVIEAAGDRRNAAHVFMKKVERFSELRGLSPTDVQRMLLNQGYAAEAVEGTMSFTAVDPAVIQSMSEIMCIPVGELQILQLEVDEEVTYTTAAPALSVGSADGSAVDHKSALASCRHQPDVGGFSWRLCGTSTLAAGKSQFFNYIYNYGEVPCNLLWDGQEQTLYQGDSVVVKPFMEVTLSSQKVRDQHYMATLVVCKVAGCVNNNVMNECSLFAAEGLAAMTTNNTKWF